MSGKGRQLQERRSRIQEPLDPLAYRPFSLLAMALDVFAAATFMRPRHVLAQLGDQLLHSSAIRLESGIGRIDVRLEDDHVSVEAYRLRSTSNDKRYPSATFGALAVSSA